MKKAEIKKMQEKIVLPGVQSKDAAEKDNIISEQAGDIKKQLQRIAELEAALAPDHGAVAEEIWDLAKEATARIWDKAEHCDIDDGGDIYPGLYFKDDDDTPDDELIEDMYEERVFIPIIEAAIKKGIALNAVTPAPDHGAVAEEIVSDMFFGGGLAIAKHFKPHCKDSDYDWDAWTGELADRAKEILASHYPAPVSDALVEAVEKRKDFDRCPECKGRGHLLNSPYIRAEKIEVGFMCDDCQHEWTVEYVPDVPIYLIPNTAIGAKVREEK